MTGRVWHEDNYSLKPVTNHTITGYAYALTNKYLRIVTDDRNSWLIGIPAEFNMPVDFSKYSEKEKLEMQQRVVSSIIGEIRRSRASYPLDLYDLRLLKVGKLYKKTEWEDRWGWEGNEHHFVPSTGEYMFFHSSHVAYAGLDDVKLAPYDGTVVPYDCLLFAFWAMTNPNAFR